MKPSRYIEPAKQAFRNASESPELAERQLILLAQNLAASRATLPSPTTATDIEFRVFSQFGDDGIIDYLVRLLKPASPIFVEFGVSDYVEATTRYLLEGLGWCGLVMDGASDNVDRIRSSGRYWRLPLEARQAFITRENVNDLVDLPWIPERIGLLHIDIDGNDYWVWEALERLEPDILVLEFNAILPNLPLSIPYRPDFARLLADTSGLYFGASLAAFKHLAALRNYHFFATNSVGNNAYFVRGELANQLPLLVQSPVSGSWWPKFREARDGSGQLTYEHPLQARLRLLGKTFVDVQEGSLVTLAPEDFERLDTSASFHQLTVDTEAGSARNLATSKGCHR